MLAAYNQRLAEAAGPLLPYLDDPAVLEVRVTSGGRVFVVWFGRGKEAKGLCPPAVLDRFLSLIAHQVGAEWRAEHPRLHAALPAVGLRIQAGREPISPGPWMVVRKHPHHVFPLADFVAKGILTAAQADRLEEYVVRLRHTVLIAGAVGSGKTTLLNSLVHLLRASEERILVCEDDPEVHCEADEVEFLHTSEEPLVTMRDLVKDVLRMSPDRLIVGEVRDGAALDMLKAFQTGTPGLGTVHAESALGVLQRLEQLVLEVSVDPQQSLIGAAIDVIVFMEKFGRSWRLSQMLAVEGWDRQAYVTRSVMP
jgi:type IV secretion system protein VirB11